MSLEDAGLSVVLPAYGEGPSLKVLLPQLCSALQGLGPSFEILVVDRRDSKDETAAVCAANGVRYVRRTGGDLYGDAVRTGIDQSQGLYVIFMDADGSHNPAELRSLWQKREEADLVIGSRYVQGGNTENPAFLIFLSFLVNVAFRLTFNLKCRDVTNSLRLYDGRQLRSLRLVCNNFDIIQEILIKLVEQDRRLRIVEVPITFERRKAGESKRDLFAFALTYFHTLVRLLALKVRTRSELTKRTQE